MLLDQDIKDIKGVGEKTAALFHKVGVYSLWDLLCYYPRNYEIFHPPVTVDQLELGEICAVGLTICGSLKGTGYGKKQVLIAMGKDRLNQGIKLTWFHMMFLRNQIKPSQYYIFRGMVSTFGSDFVLEQPKFYSPEEYGNWIEKCQPIYPVTKGLTSKGISKVVTKVIQSIQMPEDYLDRGFLEKNGLMGWKDAVMGIHFPESLEKANPARQRIAFDEFFFFILTIRRLREENRKLPNSFPMIEVAETQRLIEALPYELTGAQKRTWEEIRQDLSGEHCMNRLIQGDVGSGKTIVAILALIETCCNGFQGALMAPTEVLAMQHMESMTSLFHKNGIPLRPVLLTGSMTAKEKREAKELIQSGEANIVIGTHALIQDNVEFQSLGLVVTDEQHRFGVRQREALSSKGKSPHVLVMSATPIPRTLAIILYGDLDISVMDELPANRLPIKNCVVNADYHEKAYRFITKEISAGRQCYIICPMVEESEAIEAENVLEYSERLKSEFPESVRIAYLHGKMKPKEKNEIMESFARGTIDVLVSTTVVEVGVNVPNATVMMVENAERFGLAQLHQLRGRVGRGEYQSYCIFVSGNDRKETKERLDILNRSNDGFIIAREDMKLRGPGDLLGYRQSGLLDFKVGDIFQDAGLLKLASEYAEEVLMDDFMLEKDHNQILVEYLKRYQSRSSERINL